MMGIVIALSIRIRSYRYWTRLSRIPYDLPLKIHMTQYYALKIYGLLSIHDALPIFPVYRRAQFTRWCVRSEASTWQGAARATPDDNDYYFYARSCHTRWYSITMSAKIGLRRQLWRTGSFQNTRHINNVQEPCRRYEWAFWRSTVKRGRPGTRSWSSESGRFFRTRSQRDRIMWEVMHSRLVTARSVSFASTESPAALLTAASSGRPSSTTSAKVARWQRGAWRSASCWALGASTARCATEMEINLSPSRRRDHILIPQGWDAISAGKQSAQSAGDWAMISTISTRSRCIHFPLNNVMPVD